MCTADKKQSFGGTYCLHLWTSLTNFWKQKFY